MPRASQGGPDHPGPAPIGLGVPLLLFSSVGTFCYPAINIGPSTGIAYGTLLGLACLGLGALSGSLKWKDMAFWSILLPYLIAGALILNRKELLNSRNVVVGSVAFGISVTAMLLPQMYVAARRIDLLAAGTAIGLLAHCLVGGFQLALAGNYPSAYFAIFSNNSFALAEYATRPMGIFPEPSAMTATLGPLILVVYQLVDRKSPTLADHGLWWRFAVKASCYGGLGLVVASLSGFAPLVLVAFSFVALYNLIFIKKKIVLTVLAATASAAGILVCWWLLSERLSIELEKSTSWQTRWDSIVTAFDIWFSDPKSFFLGVGSNQLFLHMEQYGTYSSYGVLQRFANVFSITLIYLVETGIFGVIGLSIVAWMSVRSIWESGNRLGGLVTLGLWVGGATFTASYFNLYGVWFVLALFPLWKQLFPRRATSRRPIR